ncbi:MAG: helix-turn-helix transcriptional regulator [Solitalea sp.]
MDKTAPGISKKFGERLGKFKKRAHISFVKMSFGTSISANHINNTVKGKTNTTLRQLESYARFFGVRVYELLQFDAPVPDRATLQKNIRAHFKSLGYITNESFKKLGPSYAVEEFIEEYGAFPRPLEATEIKDLFNKARKTSYKTNDISRVLNRLAREELLIKKDTGNPKKPKYDTPR